MTQKCLKVFLDTSVLFSAVLSTARGARKLFLLGEAGLLKLVVGPNVLREADEVVQLPFEIGTPGDLLQKFKDELNLP